MLEKRTSGILLHLTSLPALHGIGDLGVGAYKFIDFLAAAGQSCWQFLPTGPTSTVFDNSPYMCRSVFAGNPLLINLELLLADNYLSAADLYEGAQFSEYTVDYQKVSRFKNALLQKAFANFSKSSRSSDFDLFCHEQKKWLDDFALFMSFREIFAARPWYEWPEPIARRDKKVLRQYSAKYKAAIAFHKFVQFVFFSQWQKIYSYAQANNVGLIGDIPIYVALDSADVWSNQALFKIDQQRLKPIKVAGVPPDYFSETGQRWGNPVYKWTNDTGGMNKELFDWWLTRFRFIFSLMDMVKIDHFRGFEAFWEIPAQEKTAIHGKWVKGPGSSFFSKIASKLKKLPIIAEDLGVITPEVEKMRDKLGFPGMKVLQFAFESDEKNPYLPHNFTTKNSIVYTGTHDNNTTLGWFMGSKLSEITRQRIRRYLNSNNDDNISWDLTRLAMSSIAALAITPLQDILGFGADCRMNTPGTSSGNWRWRCAPRFLNEETEHRLLDMTIFYNRLP